MQGADAAQSQVLPAGVPCIVQASLGSVAPSDILLHSLCLERSISSDGADSGLLQPQHCIVFPALLAAVIPILHSCACLPIRTPFIM